METTDFSRNKHHAERKRGGGDAGGSEAPATTAGDPESDRPR